ncbi:MAG TPA: acyl-CoA dehydrogenase family protein [Trebonia sp.]|jgi:alkylation response protein AidB-like acyl-CoA dehydrogenase|nr:acyl-CoA dehydrogenase family protein [Trebonia sp.]
MSEHALAAVSDVPDTSGDGGVADLLAAIRARRAEFEAAGALAEEMRTLPPSAVSTLRSLGLFWLKTPAEFGGTPLTPLEFSDVLEELAFIDVSTAWAMMIGNGCAGMAGGWLPDEGARRVFGLDGAAGALPLVAGQPQPRGVGRPVPGGFVVSGRWSFSSGIVHAGWVIGGFPSPDDPADCLVFVAPKDDAEVIDTWHVAGLQGTGSLDYRLSDVFVPSSMTYVRGGPAVRGGALFKQPGHLFVDNEVPPLAIGLARRALSDMAALAGQTTRLPGGRPLADRAAFHKDLGRAWTRVRAARAVHREAIAAAWAATLADGDVPASLRTAATTASVYAVETCADVVADLFRYGGGRALSLSSPLQRHLRDAVAARQHVSVSEDHYETAGREFMQSRKAAAQVE